MEKKIYTLASLLALLMGSVIALTSLLGVWFLLIQPLGSLTRQPVQLRIPKGAHAGQIADVLWQKKVIGHRSVFLLLARFSGKARQFQPGSYQLIPNRYWDAVHKISAGETYKIKVTIPEGWSAWQIARRLQEEGMIADAKVFMSLVERQKSEGFLFPETYFFEPGSEPEEIVLAMTRQFHQAYSQKLAARAQEMKWSLNQVVTLASIIEREARAGSERAVISSVYHNRLRRGQKLDADPTVQYAIARGQFWAERLSYKDLKTNSPYNTYLYAGLPPGPICNPGWASIEAALDPAQTRFYYFVADGSGKHWFASTFEEHQRNVRKFLRQRAASR